LVSRFILNLRQVVYANNNPGLPNWSMSDIRFDVNRIVGNMGEPLEHTMDDDDLEEESTSGAEVVDRVIEGGDESVTPAGE
jgi:hypothetical protein